MQPQPILRCSPVFIWADHKETLWELSVHDQDLSQILTEQKKKMDFMWLL